MIGCLCLHGFTGGPYEVAPLVEFLQERTNWTFRVPTLPGHGDTATLKGIQYKDWIYHAVKEWEALRETCDEVYVIGFSMGGLIAGFLAANYSVDKLILLSAAAYYINPGQLAADIKKVMSDLLNGTLEENELFLRYKKKITTTPLAATWQFSRLVSHIRPMLPKISAPTFIAQGDCDGIVPPKSAEFIYHTIGAKQKRISLIKNSKHHICYCEENAALFSEVFSFLQEH